MSQIGNRDKGLGLLAGISCVSLVLVGSCGGGGSPTALVVQDAAISTTGTSLLDPGEAVIITGLLDGTLSGGAPKAIEIYVEGTVDLSTLTLQRSANGGAFGSPTALSGTFTDEFAYLVGTAGNGLSDFQSVFGSSGDFANIAVVSGNVSGNGNDGFRILEGSTVLDQVWEENGNNSYQDSYWYRNDGTGPDGGWVPSNWTTPGNNALDGLNASQIEAAVPFGTYIPSSSPSPSPSNLVINEIMQNPDAVNDSNGEWFELFNPGSSAVDIDGWTIRDNGSDSHVINNGGPLLVPAGGYAVLTNNADTATNGGFTADYQYSGFFIGNSDDEIVLIDPLSNEIDRVEYDGGPNFPDPTGASMCLTDPASDNNVGSNWTTSTTPFGDGDLGTPGAMNDCVGMTPSPMPSPTPSPGTITPIFQIQGPGHVSPFVLGPGQTVNDFFDTAPSNDFNVPGDMVTTQGIVTARDDNGFYIQDRMGDGNPDTSDALFVFTSSSPPVQAAIGTEVQVQGTVSEFFPGRVRTGNLPLTQITNPTSITVIDPGPLSLPTPVIIGSGGRIPPTENIDDDAFTSFDPMMDGIDFFEALEAMVVTAQNAQAVVGTNRFGEIFTVVDNGTGATGLSMRDTLNISPNDFNPEKVQIDEDTGILPGFSLPAVTTGDQLGNVTGVISYDFGNYQIQPTQSFGISSASGLTPETSSLSPGTDQVTIATYNVLNLDPVVEDPSLTQDGLGDVDDDLGDGRFDAIANQIINNLNQPDILCLQEVQDNDGAEITSVTAADVTLQTLINAITTAGGSPYQLIDNPAVINGAGGGQPGGNIRTAFLYNPSRVNPVAGSVGSIDTSGNFTTSPTNFFNSRPPLVAEFTFNSESIQVVCNHFSSKGGSSPILGVEQPFEARQEEVLVNGSLDERQQQSGAVQTFVNTILTPTPDSNVVVLGDLNEFEFISPVTGLVGAGLTNLIDTLVSADERYSFIFQGNSQQLDHILVSNSLNSTAELDIVHTNTEFPETSSRASDHDPVLSRFTLASAPPTSVQVLSTQLRRPYGVAVDDRGTPSDLSDDLYAVVEYGLRPSGAALRLIPTTGGSGSVIPLDVRPFAVGVASPGVYIIVDVNGGISRVQNQQRTLIGNTGAGVSVDIEVPDPNTAFVIPFNDQTVKSISLSDGSLNSSVSAGGFPYGYSPDPLGSGFFVTFGGSPTVLGTEAGLFSLQGSLGFPAGIDTDGTLLYVADQNGSVKQVDPTTGAITLVTDQNLGQPFGLTVNLDGSLLVTDPRGSRLLQIFNP